jgi:hypothetical protein
MNGEAAQAAHSRDDGLPSSTVNESGVDVVTPDKLATQNRLIRKRLLKMFSSIRVENDHH